jgi:hypothetical protein
MDFYAEASNKVMVPARINQGLDVGQGEPQSTPIRLGKSHGISWGVGIVGKS